MINKFNRPLSVCQQKVFLAWDWNCASALLSEEETGVSVVVSTWGLIQISQKFLWSSTYCIVM